jgi:SagB-type dehydrogenase family enzyme
MANEDSYPLPRSTDAQGASLTRILQARRTIRSFAPRPLLQMQVAQLLWAAQGVTSPEGYRTAPSAGALYPLELHLVAGNVEGLPSGSYHYDPARHLLQATVHGDLRLRVAESALNQHWIAEAPAVLVISAIETRTTAKYGRRGVRYVHMEVGHACQNLLLQAVALGLAGAIVGAFDDERLQRLLQLPAEERPLAILPVGHPLSQASPEQ